MIDNQPSTIIMTDTATNIDDRSATPAAGSSNDDSISSYNDNDISQKQQNSTQTQEEIRSNQNTSPPPNTNASQIEPIFKFGPYVPIVRSENGILIDPRGIVGYYSETNQTALSDRLNCEVFPEDAIVEAPSLVTPLLLKKKTRWPPNEVIKELLTETGELINGQQTDSVNNISQVSDSSDIQVIKVVNIPSSTAKVPDSNVDNNKKTNDYVKSTTVASLTNTKVSSNNSILTIEDYYKSSVGEMLLGIGLSRVKEFNQEDNVKRLAHKIRKGGDSCKNLIEQIEPLRAQLLQTKVSNKPFKFKQLLKCPHCYFRSESSIVMSGHMESPHMSNKREYMCNWCDYKAKDSNQTVFHNLIEHKKRCRIDRPPALHNCRYCPYECRSKKKMAAHIARCEQVFPHHILLGPQDYGENDFPAITSKFITQEDVKSYEQTLKALRLAAYNPHQLRVPGFQQYGLSHQPVFVVPRQNVPFSSSSNFVQSANQNVNLSMGTIGSPFGSSVNLLTNSNSVTANSTQNINNSAQLLHLLSAQNANLDTNKSGMLQHPRTLSSFMNGKSVMKTASDIIMAPHNQSGLTNGTTQVMNLNNISGDPIKISEGRQANQSLVIGTNSATIGPVPNPKGSTFVICEICDGYIKDLSQLKSHMQWIHKVKIHQKMLESRPPLNCQKCQWRFFTDQGLERHLLGAHGLVTSNMQEQVDLGTDSGRCTVCGRAYANKLVAHMKEVHKSNLKPAHLSYKCTVCSATFNLYRLFENHVYSVHSESVRRISSN